jgi:hypothetical protein
LVPARWSELYADRWLWSERALARLRRDLRDPGLDIRAGRLAHVMVVGDTGAGKTSLLLRLLGVDPTLAVTVAEPVLRGGRTAGDSSTSLPIRYRWSADPDRWELARTSDQVPELLDNKDMCRAIAPYRSGEDGSRLLWRPEDPPIQVGLPTRLAGPGRRTELRVLDLPGLFARGPEQQTAESIVAHFAPAMNVIVFVAQANKPDAFNDHAIRTNAHLATWTRNTSGFRVVLTFSYSDPEVWEDPGRRGLGDPAALAAHIRRWYADRLRKSLDSAVIDDIAPILYPVEVGGSLARYLSAFPHPAAEAVNDIFLRQLSTSIQSAASEDGYYLSTGEVVVRLTRRIQLAREDRARRLATLHGQLTAATAERTDAEQHVRERRRERVRRAAQAEDLDRAVAELRGMTISCGRLDRPRMTGPGVRESQEDERTAWFTAATRLWADWRTRNAKVLTGTPIPEHLPVSEAELRRTYDKLVDCCHICSDLVPWRNRPEYCYGKMRDADERMAAFILSRLVAATDDAVRQAGSAARRVEVHRNVAEQDRDALAGAITVARARLRRAAREAAEQDAQERQDLRTARTITRILDEENRAYFAELLGRLHAAPTQDRGWYAVAALRALYDLDRTMRTA